ncbi:MAG: energy transducer TonB [Muribaculaceae bacterium]|nr:energy transducer TonB [Muribaculaceae bacterium]
MAREKQTCRILREIRRQIAEANEIDYVTQECRYKGDCKGTCPKCESEVRWLERQLQTRALAGKAVALAGISAGLFMSGCGSSAAAGSSDSLLHSINSEVAKDTVFANSEYPCDRELAEVDVTAMSPDDKFGEVAYEEEQEKMMRLNVSESSKTKNAGAPSVESQEDERAKALQEAVVVGGVDDTLFKFDKYAEFPGGIDALFGFLLENIEYPEEAREKDIEGRVIVKFIIDETGMVKDAAIAKGVHPLLDNEALRVVHKLPRFIPAEYEGKPKPSYFSLPINFRFSDKDLYPNSKSDDE